MYESDRARSETKGLMEASFRLMQAFPGYRTSFALRPDLCDAYTAQQRAELDWRVIADTMITTARSMIDDGDVPARRVHTFGDTAVARTQDELHALGAGGCTGLYWDDDFEAERVIKRAIQQLPSGTGALIYLDWTAATQTFFRAVERRMSKLPATDPRIAGVLVRKSMFTKRDVVPATSVTLIENPNLPGLARGSPVTAALAADGFASLRDLNVSPALEV